MSQMEGPGSNNCFAIYLIVLVDIWKSSEVQIAQESEALGTDANPKTSLNFSKDLWRFWGLLFSTPIKIINFHLLFQFSSKKRCRSKIFNTIAQFIFSQEFANVTHNPCCRFVNVLCTTYMRLSPPEGSPELSCFQSFFDKLATVL